MTTVKQSEKGIGYLFGTLKEKPRVITRAKLWRIPHHHKPEEIQLKIGRYNKSAGYSPDELESGSPKSELTLDSEELNNLVDFISQNYAPIKAGLNKYIPIEGEFDEKTIGVLKNIFNNPDKEAALNFIFSHDLISEDLLSALENRKQRNAVAEFEAMLSDDLVEQNWQEWFSGNQWVLGSDIVEILDERRIDTANITDYLVRAHDGFLDIIEIKRPDGNLQFWSSSLDHGNYVPSSDLTKAVTQANKYIYEIERESNSVKFIEKVGIKTVKPRCSLIFGRSNNWNDHQKEAYRILNASYHNINILTYDHVLERAKRILGISSAPQIQKDDDFEEIPF